MLCVIKVKWKESFNSRSPKFNKKLQELSHTNRDVSANQN